MCSRAASLYSRAVSIPICGIGGIESAADAVKFLLCGATAVQVGTANFTDPTIAVKIVDEFEEYCVARGIGPADLIGKVEVGEAK